MSLRPPREEDAVAVAELASRHSPEPVLPDRLLHQWRTPKVDLERDARVDGEAYALVDDLGEGRIHLTLFGRPSGELLDWAEARAAESGSRLLTGVWETERTSAALERRGFRLIRHMYRMAIDLEREPEPAVWPQGISVRTFEPGDERTFYETHQETFADHWEPVEMPYAVWRHHALQPPVFDPQAWLLALAGDEVAGFAICHLHWSNGELGWVGALGVRRQSRRRGLGRALLTRAFGDFHRRGLRHVGLGVVSGNLTGANRLYESAGMRVAHRGDIFEKRLG